MDIEIYVAGDDLPDIKLVRVPHTGTLRDVVEAARREGLPVAADHSDAVVFLEGGDQELELDRQLEELGIGHHHRLRCHRRVHVTVNQKPVAFHRRTATGTQIKQAAISQGVNIQADFSLFEVRGADPLKLVGDAEAVTLHEHEKFRATAPDDNS